MKFAILATAVAAVFAGKEVKLNLAKVGAKVNTWNYGNPALGCMTGEQNVSITGLPGDFCSPACDAAGNCPTNYAPGIDASTQGQCVLEEAGSNNPTLCALLCTPGTANACDANGATCQPIQGVGLCTY